MSDEAQNTFEYVLVVGAVIVAMITGLIAFDLVIAQFVGFVCPSVDTAQGIGATVGSCIQSVT